MHDILSRLWPMHRTVNSDDIERAIAMCRDYIGVFDVNSTGFTMHAYPAKSDQLTWWVPERYHVNDAWLEVSGERVADFKKNSLHLLSYSLPTEIDGTLGEIRDHLWTRKNRPNAIPWEFKYYERSWGFCLRHSDLERFDDAARVRGRIDVEFRDAPLPVGEFYLPGTSGRDIMFLVNICHPMQVNDSISGLVVGLEMARILARSQTRKNGFRLLIVPETIGSVAWFANNEDKAAQTDFAWFCEMVGHNNSFILQRSRQGDSLIDRAFFGVMRQFRKHGEEREGPFRSVVASDEIVSNGPGYNIPTPSLTRWPYDEYHTSDDNPSLIEPANLVEALEVCIAVWDALETNFYPRRRFKGPLMLSRHGLWVDWRENLDLNLKTEAIMLMLEGDKSLIDIVYELGLPFETVRHYLGRMAQAGMIDQLNVPYSIK